MKKKIRTCLCLLILLCSNPSFSQDTIQKPSMLNFFLDCDRCDFNYVREELPFVSFVRDPLLADVHILVTTSHTGSDGHKFFLNFIGMKSFRDVNCQYEVITSQSDTDDDVRKALLKMLKVGLLTYYSKTSFFDDLNIDVEESGNRKAGSMVIDRWNKWIFSLETGAELQKEQSQNEYAVDMEASASKITEDWKIRLNVAYEINRENFYDDEELITNKQDTRELNAGIVRSITGKWSAGLFSAYQSRTFLNIRHNLSTGLGIQYNFFPWSECNRRVFSVGYLLGFDYYSYNEVTIYDKLSEMLPAEVLMIELELIQPWGEVSISLQGQNYFNDFSKNRVVLGSDFSVRLTKNLSVFCYAQSQLIHDQLYLPKGDASLEDILLRRRKLATTYEIEGHLGFRFTFGSIFNNVVNERFKME